MNLLTYTRYLRQKVKYYDKLISKINKYSQNPFQHNENLTTIIWVEDDNSSE